MKTLHNRIVLFTLFIFSSTLVFSQQGVGIGTSAPNQHAVLDVVSSSNNKGILIPRLTTSQRNAMSGSLATTEVGLMVFDVDINGFYYWDGIAWASIVLAQNISISGNTVGIDGGGSGFSLSPTTPSAGQVLKWNGSAWEAAIDDTSTGGALPVLGNAQIVTNNGANLAVSISGDITMNNVGVMTIQPNAVGSVEIMNGSITDADVSTGAAISASKLDPFVMEEGEDISLLNDDIGLLTDISGFTTDDLAEGIGNRYYSDALVDARMAATSVTVFSDVSNAGSGMIITGAERTAIGTNSTDIAANSGNIVINTNNIALLQSTGVNSVQAANLIYGGPPTAPAANPTFRALVANDIPSLDASKVSSGTFSILRGGTNTTSIGVAGSMPYSNGTSYQFTGVGTSGQVLLSNGAAAPTWQVIPAQFTTVNNIPKGSGSGMINSGIYENATGNVGFGTAAPSAGIHSVSNNGLLSTGTFGSGTIPATTVGAKMMWYSRKGAFYAGQFVTAADIADANIGNYAVSLGLDGRANGEAAVSIGYDNNVDGNRSAAIGNANTVSSVNAYAFGWINNAGGNGAMALGFVSSANANNSFSLGSWVSANAIGSSVIGVGVGVSQRINNGIANSLMIGYNSNIPTLFVGPSAGAGTTGNVGVGNSTPSSKLDVSGTITSTGIVISTAPTVGYVLTSNATGAGTWQQPASAFGTAGGDLTGTYPNPTLGLNVVDSTNITNNSVISADIRDGAVTSADILNGTITSADIIGNGVTSFNILNSTIANIDVSTAAAILGTKISPNFGAQNVVTTGNIGIGIAVPLTNLDVRGNQIIGTGIVPTAATSDNILNLQVGNNLDGATNGISFYELTGGFGMKLGYDGSGGGANNKLAIYNSDDAEVMVFENGGNLGLGVTNPAQRLEVVGNTVVTGNSTVDGNLTVTSANELFVNRISSVDNNANFMGWDVGGTGVFRIHTGTNPVIYGEPDGRVRIGTQGNSSTAKLLVQGAGAGTNISLLTTNSFGNAGLVVLANGNVGIRTTPSTNDLEVNGTASKTTAGTWLANSDRRIKTNVTDIDNSIELIKKIRPVKFKYTEHWKTQNPSIEDRFYYNFIAQEYQEVFPNAVKGSGEYIDGDPAEILQIDTYDAQITGLKALQELIYRVETLERENGLLKKEIASINALEEDVERAKLKKDNAEIRRDYENLKADILKIQEMLNVTGKK